MSRIIELPEEEAEAPKTRDLIFKTKDGKDEVFSVPTPMELEADLFELMRSNGISQFMAAMLARHAPVLAKRLKVNQMVSVWNAWIGDDEVTPGESEASSES